MSDSARRMQRSVWAAGVLSVLITLSACGGSGGSSRGGANVTGELLLSDGVTVHLVSAENGLAVAASASVPEDASAPGDDIFGLLLHPTKPWIYATVLSNCEVGNCWGNARVERFELTSQGPRYGGTAFNYLQQAAGLASCVDENDGEDSCAPVSGAFSADGTLLYLKDDDTDVLHLFSVDARTGALTLLSESAEIYMHGIAVHPAGEYLYNGSNVVDIRDDNNLMSVFAGDGGNDTQVIAMAEETLLFSTIGTRTSAVWSLLEPAAPQLIDQVQFGEHRSRAMAVTADGTRLVAAGRNQVASMAFDGDTLTVLDQLDVEVIGEPEIENRAVTWVEDGSLAAVAWFQRNNEAPSGQVGGLALYAVDEAGVLTQVDLLNTEAASRAVVVLP